MAQRRCYGYDIGLDGELTINPDESAVICWIFQSYLCGDSLGKTAAALEAKNILSSAGKPKWKREALNRLLSNEKCTRQVLLQETVSIKFSISDEFFMVQRQEKFKYIRVQKM